ncbi:MAG TPA: hypothetical protein VNX21_02170 [Candidatus Thermoplasmatota archaeon]|nr:hypothetical protein [Candidatus Thermoplasmatota archaeon]
MRADPGPGHVVTVLVVAWLAASVLLFPLALLAYAGLSRWLGARARAAAWALAALGLGGAAAWMLAARGVPGAMARGEETAFLHLCAGTAMLLALAWRRGR